MKIYQYMEITTSNLYVTHLVKMMSDIINCLSVCYKTGTFLCKTIE